MIRFISMTAAVVAAFTMSASAEPQLKRVRGTVESATDTSVSVKSKDGSTETVTFTPDTAFVNVVKSSLDEVGEGKFIGTATKGEPPVALEVVIFPDAMKGTAEGHYAWDSINDTTQGGKGPVKSSMTNGTVKPNWTTKSSMTNGTVKPKMTTKSSMTNGTVKKGSDAEGGKTITVTYDNGQSLDVKVPPSAPIVAFEKADKSILKPGAILFSVTAVEGDKLNGKLVAVGKDGVTPPM